MKQTHPLERWRQYEVISSVCLLGSAAALGWYIFFVTPQAISILSTLAGLCIGMALARVLCFVQVNKLVLRTVHSAQATTAVEFISLYERSPVAYLTVLPNGQITRFNPAAIRLLDATLDTLKGKNLCSQIIEVKKTDVEVMLGKLHSGVLLSDVEVCLRTYADKTIWVLLSASAEPRTGERLLSLVDITEAQKVDTAKSEFLALATHQLRTPIAAIRWNTELLTNSLKTTATDKQSQYLVKIARNVVRMNTLINDFLHVSKLEMGTFATEAEQINLTEYFDTILDEYADKFIQKQLQLVRHEAVPNLSLTTDRRLFHIIVSNLLSNAAKYATQSGTIWLSADVKDEYRLVLTIADNGIGIPKDEVKKLFTKFYRATNAVTQQAEGTGLGLYIVKQAVEQLGGTITVAAEAAKGATFVVELPLTR